MEERVVQTPPSNVIWMEKLAPSQRDYIADPIARH